VLREDDHKEIVIQRYEIYKKTIAKVLTYYQGQIINIRSDRNANQVFAEILKHC
jgi:adenylate kinase family enzyme